MRRSHLSPAFLTSPCIRVARAIGRPCGAAETQSNENPRARPAIEQAAAQMAAMHRYPSTDHADLRAAIAAIHEVTDNIICGVGSDEVIHFLCRPMRVRAQRALYHAMPCIAFLRLQPVPHLLRRRRTVWSMWMQSLLALPRPRALFLPTLPTPRAPCCPSGGHAVGRRPA